MYLARSPALCLLAASVVLAGCQDEADKPGLEVPSGREVSLIEIVTNAPGPEGAAARFRFLAPGLTSEEIEAAAADLQALCDGFAAARIDGMVPVPQQIIVSLSAEAVPFGEPAPGVVQVFESFRLENGRCIWEAF